MAEGGMGSENFIKGRLATSISAGTKDGGALSDYETLEKADKRGYVKAVRTNERSGVGGVTDPDFLDYLASLGASITDFNAASIVERAQIMQAFNQERRTKSPEMSVFTAYWMGRFGTGIDFVNQQTRPEWTKGWSLNELDVVQLADTTSKAMRHKINVRALNLEEAMLANPELRSDISTETVAGYYLKPGGKECWEAVFQRYFEIDKRTSRNGRVRIKFKDPIKDVNGKVIDRMVEFTDKVAYRTAMEKQADNIAILPEVKAEVLTKWPGISAKDYARMMMATARNLTGLGHVAESADSKRLMVPGSEEYSPLVRTIMHPLAQLRAKLRTRESMDPQFDRFDLDRMQIAAGKAESYGGTLGDEFVKYVDSPRLNNRLQTGEIVPLPETLFLSVWEMEKGEKDKVVKALAQPDRIIPGRSIAQMLIEGDEIQWDAVRSQAFFGGYADKGSAAYSIYKYCLGDKDYLIKPGDTDVMWESWGKDLGNAEAKLAETPLAHELATINTRRWQIAACLKIAINPNDGGVRIRDLRRQGVGMAWKIIHNMFKDSRLSYIVGTDGEYNKDSNVESDVLNFWGISFAGETFGKRKSV